MAKRYAVRSRYSLIAILALALTSLSFAQVRPSGPTASSPQLKGEGGLPILENYSRKDYSFGGEFWTILQDRRGVMYFGSDSVILEYDGVTWRKIFLPTDVVRSLAVDDTGRIWVGGAANFGYLAPDAAGTLQFVSLLDQVPSEQRRFTSVWQTLVTPQGIFFRSYEELFRWDGKKMQVWSPTQAKARFQALSIIRGHIYTSQEGIGLQEIVGDELRNLPGGDAYRASAKLFLYPYDDNRILISARDQLFTLYDGQKATPFPTEADEYLKKHDLYTSTVLADGGICATTLSGGAIIVGHDGKLRQIIDQGAGLLSSNVLTSYSDREGGLWLGLVNSISRVDVNSPVTILSRPAVYDVARFKDTIYTTTAGGESPVSRLTFDPKAGRLSLVPLQGAAGITQAFILQVFKDPSGKGSEQLLAATSKGVMKVEGNKLIPVEPSIFDQKEGMYFLSQSRKTPERIFLGHFDGLSSIRWDGRKWINEGRLSKTIYSVRDVAEDAHGTVWASGASGVLRVAIAPTGMGDSKVQVISEGLPEGSTDAQFLDGSVFVTVTRSKNIFRWDEAAHQFIVDNRFLLPIDAPDATSFLLPDDQGRVWSLTDSSGSHRFGVFSKQPDGTWRADEDPYRRLDRFQTFNVHFQPGGVIWLTGEHLFRYAPRSSSAAVQSFATLVRQVNSGSQVVFGGGTADAASDPRLPPGSSSMRFQFAAPTYENPEGMDYQYFLEGIDRDWSVWGSRKRRTTMDWVRVNIASTFAREPTMAAAARKGSTPSRSFHPGTVLVLRRLLTACFSCSLLMAAGNSSAGMSAKSRAERRKHSKFRPGLSKQQSVSAPRRYALRLLRSALRRKASNCSVRSEKRSPLRWI